MNTLLLGIDLFLFCTEIIFFLIHSPSFYSTDPFLVFLKMFLGKGTPTSASLRLFFLRIPMQQVLHSLTTTPDAM
jgi:hypothetical protein